MVNRKVIVMYSEDGGARLLQNVVSDLSGFAVSNPRRQ
jgi:hypothetical protein